MHRLLRFLGLAAYAGFVLTVFVLTAYLSFNLFVRSGGARTPEIVGLDLEEARSLVNDQGYELEVEEDGRFSDQVAAGDVMIQNPAAGALVKRGSAIKVVLSLGPQRIDVPDLAGLGIQAAQVTLAGAGLGLGRTIDVTSRDGDVGTVVGQEPRPGTQVSATTEVHVLLAQPASGEIFVMPDLVYRDLDRVRSFFESRGFRIGSVKFERYEGIRPGTVLRQVPLAGHPVGKNEDISLVVAAAPRRDGFDLPSFGGIDDPALDDGAFPEPDPDGRTFDGRDDDTTDRRPTAGRAR